MFFQRICGVVCADDNPGLIRFHEGFTFAWFFVHSSLIQSAIVIPNYFCPQEKNAIFVHA
jgi:hypothetical protein